MSGCTVYQSKLWTVLCLYECTMKCTSKYIQEWVNCVCTSVWAACANTVNVVCTVVCFCDDTLPCYDELSTMHSLLCTLIWWYDDEHACFDVMAYFYALWCVPITCTLHVDDDGGYLMMMIVHTLWLWCITYDDVQQ